MREEKKSSAMGVLTVVKVRRPGLSLVPRSTNIIDPPLDHLLGRMATAFDHERMLDDTDSLEPCS